MKRTKALLTPEDVSKMMLISIQTAYKIVRELNKEIQEINEKRKKNGEDPYVVFRTKIYAKYFQQRFYDIEFLKIEDVEKYGIKNYEAKEIYSEIKSELLHKGYRVVKGRIPKKYLELKFIS